MQPTAKELKNLLGKWREYADGHYCQTYNRGMADGLNRAACELEELLSQRRLTTASTVTAER